MRAITVSPGVANSARLDDVADRRRRRTARSWCARWRSACAAPIARSSPATTAATPPGEQRLVLGHESLGRVEEAPAGRGFAPGDLVVGIVRRPDPVPCPACAAGEWDMCRNGRYVERGIKERHGYGAEQFRIEPGFAIKIDPALGILGVLVEPTSVVAKAWDHIERIGARARAWQPRTRAGHRRRPDRPAGGADGRAARPRGACARPQRERARSPRWSRELGATYHDGRRRRSTGLQPDILIECTGAPAVIRDVLGRTAPAGIVCLAGVTAPGHAFDFDIGALNRTMVLNNETVFGTVNANRRHYEMAADALARADKDWLGRLITRRVPVARWDEALAAPARRHQGHHRFRGLTPPWLPHRRLRAHRRLRDGRAGRHATARSTGCAGRASIPRPVSRRCSARPRTAAG